MFGLRPNKTNIICEPFGDWNLVPKIKRNTFFQNVCLPKTYQVEDAPLIETPVHMTFTDFKIVEVDERKKSMDLLTKIWFFWKDDRIKFSPLKVKSVRLPSITKTGIKGFMNRKIKDSKSCLGNSVTLSDILINNVYFFM